MLGVFDLESQDGESTCNEQCKATISSVTRTTSEPEEWVLLFLVESVCVCVVANVRLAGGLIALRITSHSRPNLI